MLFRSRGVIHKENSQVWADIDGKRVAAVDQEFGQGGRSLAVTVEDSVERRGVESEERSVLHITH